MLKANNARVKVDFDGPAEYLALVDTSINNLLNDLSPDVVEAGRRYDSCDLSVPPGGCSDLECRLARAALRGEVGQHRVMDASSGVPSGVPSGVHERVL